jgi:hypothetical protein
MYGNRKCVTADNLFASCELANLLLTKNMTVIGVLRTSGPAVPTLLLSGKRREVYTSVCCTSDLTLVSYVPARNKAVILSTNAIMTHAWVKKKITNLKLSCITMPLKVGLTLWTSL